MYVLYLFEHKLNVYTCYHTDIISEKKGRCTGRAVFTPTQKNWLEYYFQIEKYITKQNRIALASSLGLTDLQVRINLAISITYTRILV